MSDTFKNQLSAVISEAKQALSSHSVTLTKIIELQTRCVAAIERASGPNSPYCRQIEKMSSKNFTTTALLDRQTGVAEALLSDIENGYLGTLEELAHGNIFSDFLEMADYLVGKGYKDAAAVLAGSTLEVHLRNLCSKNGIAVTSNGKPKKAESMNVELKKGSVYTILEQKQVTAWLDLRNHAAHGKYKEYTKEQVQLLVGGVRDFLIRYPA